MNDIKTPEKWMKISDFERLTGVNGRTVRSAVKKGRIPADCVKRFDDNPAAPYYIDPQPAAIHWYNNINGNSPLSKTVKNGLAAYIQTFCPVEVLGMATPEDQMSLNDAQRRERAAKARLAELELAEKEGSLVEKATIDAELFAAAQEIRNALLVIPDRIIDQVIAEAANRNKAHGIIYNAIADELEKLADIGARLEK
ncbi:hypothetical protein [uncultured Rikenella sp.]|uniref:hypothetical protein n=1 Tax=uncultured Rikenella sp. TaxID=368003 RepID=UPI00272A7233|nr:hypothetical protein [uncultured Rikenella sp.]